LKQCPKRAELRVDDRISDKQLVKLTVDKNFALLEDLKEELNRSATFLFDTSLFDIASNDLQRANDDYGKIYDLGSQFADLSSIGIQNKANIDSLRELQSSTGVFNVLFQRLFQSGSPALFFLIIALVFDFLLVLLVSFGYRAWHEVFPNAACVVSMVDRLVHNAEVVSIRRPVLSSEGTGESHLERFEGICGSCGSAV